MATENFIDFKPYIPNKKIITLNRGFPQRFNLINLRRYYINSPYMGRMQLSPYTNTV